MYGWKTLRSEQYRYVVEANGREPLYDLDTDPIAYRDLCNDAKYVTILATMRHKRISHQLISERPLQKTWPYWKKNPAFRLQLIYIASRLAGR